MTQLLPALHKAARQDGARCGEARLERGRQKSPSVGVRLLLAGTFAFGALLADAANAAVYYVGPERALKLPSDAAEIVQDGDIVRLDPGEYVDCAIWRANGLVLEAPDGAAHVRDQACAGKAIWVISGDDITIDNITFSGARVPDQNGAGIRAEGKNLTVRNSRFFDNENGILAGSVEGSAIVIENSRFERNGKCDRACAHGMYVNAIDRLEITGSTFREQRIGHHVKSQARALIVSDSTIEDGPDGTASYLIDVGSAGEVTIANNVLQKGPKAENWGTAIHIAGKARSGAVYRIVDNRFRNDSGRETAFVRNRTGVAALLEGNRVEGPGVPLVGPGTVSPAPGGEAPEVVQSAEDVSDVGTPEPAAGPQEEGDLEGKLRLLKRWFEEDLITEEEYSAKKRDLLKRL